MYCHLGSGPVHDAVCVRACVCVCVQVEKEEQAKREAEEAQAQAQLTDQWSSVVPPAEVPAESSQWDATGDVSILYLDYIHVQYVAKSLFHSGVLHPWQRHR